MINLKKIINIKSLKQILFSVIMFVVIILCLNININLFAATYPTATVNINNNPSPGYILLGSYNIPAGFFDNYGMAPDSLIKKWTNLKTGADFKLHKNGLFTFYDHSKEKFMVLNSDLNLVDSVKCVGNYLTDFHDIQYNSNGNILIIGVDERFMDLSQIVVNGKTNAKVKGFVLQELNPQKQLVWQWSTFDYFKVTDAVSTIDLTGNSVSFCHINSAIYDTDGNIIISSRYMDELTKINRQTGQIIWRFGGQSCENNQFSFTNDTDENGYIGFSHQHTPIRLKNGNLMVFDNGNVKSNNQYTRVVEYEINETNKTAKKVWEFRLTPDYYTAQMGSVQELENGNIFISWGKRQTEVTKNKVVVFDMEFLTDLSYRGYKFIHDMDALGLLVNTKKNYSYNTSSQKTNVDLNIDTLNGTGLITVQRHKYTPPYTSFNTLTPSLLPIRYVITKSDSISSFKANFKVDTRTIPNFNLSDSVKIYYRSKENGGTFSLLNTIYGNNTIECRIPGECELIFGYRLPLLAPNLTYPANNSIGISNKNLSLKWIKVSTATNYQIQLSNDKSFNNILLDTLVGDIDRIIYNFKYYTKYYIRIKSINSNEESNWSNIINFETIIESPILLLPTNKEYKIDIKDTLKWQLINGADLYNLIISKNLNFATNEIVLDTNLSNTEFIFDKFEFNKKYYWKLIAQNDTTQSESSAIFEFTTKLPKVKLVSPQNNEKYVPLNLVIKWDKINSNIFYHIEISEDNKFSKIIYTDNKLIDTFTIAKNLKNNKIYYWRIRAFDNNNQSDWSEIFEFSTIINTPKLLRPNNSQINLELTAKLVWEDVINATKYKLQLAKDSNFENILLDTIVNDENNSEISYEINNLEISTNYFWRVKAINDFVETEFSNIFGFTTRNKNFTTTPILINPINNSNITSDTVKFEWAKVSNAIQYRFQIAKNNLFEPLIIDDTLIENYTTTDILIKDLKYFWRVMAIGAESNSNWSNIRSFTIKDESSILPKPILNNPQNNSNDVSVKPILKWEDNIVYTKFNVSIIKDTTTENVIEVTDFIGNELDFAKLNIPKLDYETKYFWKIQGYNAESSSDWSDIWSFTTEKDTLTSVNNYKHDKYEMNINIYPNPFDEYLFIKLNSVLLENVNEKIVNIEIISLLGDIINIKYEINDNLIKIDTKNLQSNVYLIKLNLNNNNFKTFKLFKN